MKPFLSQFQLDVVRILALLAIFGFLYLAWQESTGITRDCRSVWYPVVNDSLACLKNDGFPHVFCQPLHPTVDYTPGGIFGFVPLNESLINSPNHSVSNG